MVELVSLRKTNEVAAYVRASMDRKGDRWTVETQLRKIRALAEAKDWKVVEVYDDNAVSATKKRRAGTRWAEMLEDARAGKFSMVVAVDMDRLLRSTKDLNTLIDLGLRVVTVDGEIDLSTADGEFRATMLAALARFEARRKAERQIRSNERRRAEGIPTSAWKAFGWTRDGELIEEEAAAVRRAFDAFLGEPSLSIRRIREDLNSAGHFTARGSEPDGVGGGIRGLCDRRPAGTPGGGVVQGGGGGGDVERLGVRHRHLGHDAQPGGLRCEPGGEGDGVLAGGVVVAEDEQVVVGVCTGRRVKCPGGGGQRVEVERGGR